MKRDFKLYLSDIIENIDDARSFISGISYEQFVDDKKTVNATIRSIEVVGEAVKNIPDNIRNMQPDVPWRDMAGMRDKCIHDYMGIDYEVVWSAVTDELPLLYELIKMLLEKLNSD